MSLGLGVRPHVDHHLPGTPEGRVDRRTARDPSLDRAELLHTLATLPAHPGSVPINQLVQVEGTPLAQNGAFDPLEFVRTVAVARILMPASHVRLSAGREEMSDETQALSFLAGANSIFYGEKLLTTDNPDTEADRNLMARLGIEPEPGPASKATPN